MKSGRAHIFRFLACPLILAGMLFLLCSCTSVREDNGTPSPSVTVDPTVSAPIGEELPTTPEPTDSQAGMPLPTRNPQDTPDPKDTITPDPQDTITPDPTITTPGTDEPGGFEIPIDETYFADAEFRRFISDNLDTNKNGSLSEAEINAVTELDIRTQVTNLEGIAFFGELVSLTCSNTPLNYLDVSRNAHLKYLNCSGNRLHELYFGDNSPLEEIDCRQNSLSSLDLSGCPQLRVLNCELNGLSRLNIRNNTRLKDLRCAFNDLPLLNLTGLTELTILNCSVNRLTELDLSNCSLTELLCASNNLKELDLQAQSSLKVLDCSNNPALSSLSTVNQPLLECLNCCNCNLKGALDLESNDRLISLRCDGNMLNNILGLTKLKLIELYCSSNELTSLDLSVMNELKKIDCSDNRISSLVIAPNTEELYCQNNELEELKLVPTLTYLDCSLNHFMRFSPQDAPLLQTLCCSDNTFTSLDLRGLGALEELYCGSGNLTSLDLSGHSLLRILDCSYSHVGSLNLSGCTSLTSVNCSFNRLSKLDLTGLGKLILLDCSNNELSELDLTDTRELLFLLCKKNQLSSLDAGNCYRLAGCAILSDKGLPVRLFAIHFDRDKYVNSNRSNYLTRADRYKKDLSGRYESGVIRTAGLIETIRSDDRTRVEIYESAVYGRIQGADGENELYDYSVFARVVSNEKYLITERIFTTTEPLSSDQHRFKYFPGRITNELCWGYDLMPEKRGPDYEDDLALAMFGVRMQFDNTSLPTIEVTGTPGDWYYIDPDHRIENDTDLPFWRLPDAHTGCIGRSSLIYKDAEHTGESTVIVDTYLFGNFSSTPDLMTRGEVAFTDAAAESLEQYSYPYAIGVPGEQYLISIGEDFNWRIDDEDAGMIRGTSPYETLKRTRTFASGMVLTITDLPYYDSSGTIMIEVTIEVSGTAYSPLQSYFIWSQDFVIKDELKTGWFISSLYN